MLKDATARAHGHRRVGLHGRFLRSQTGFSLLETMIASIILTILLMALMVVMVQGQNAFNSLAVRSCTQMRVQNAIDKMVHELRGTGAGTVCTGSPLDFFVQGQTYDNVSFRPVDGVSGGAIVWGNLISFRFDYDPGEGDSLGVDDDGDDLVDEGRLVRSEAGSDIVLASDVTALGFTMNAGQLCIQLTISSLDEKSYVHSFSGVSSVSFRNQ